MISKLAEMMKQYRKYDQAILFLRIFIGTVLGIHVIGKLQRYNYLIDGYPPLLFDNPTASFIIFATAEAIFAAMIICGFWTRFAAFIMAMGMFVDIFIIYPTLGWLGVERQVLLCGIYIFLIISGCGKYGLDYHIFRKKDFDNL